MHPFTQIRNKCPWDLFWAKTKQRDMVEIIHVTLVKKGQ